MDGNILKETENEKNQRVVTFLNRGEVDFLDKLGKDALFSTGLKLSRARIIAWMVDFIRELNITGQNVKTEYDFESKIKEVMGRNTKRSVPLI